MLNVHHIYYDRLGDENVTDDLITICEPCHIGMHKKVNAKRMAFDAVIDEFQAELKAAISQVQDRYTEKQSSVLASILGEYPNWRGMMVLQKLIRRNAKIDWDDVDKLTMPFWTGRPENAEPRRIYMRNSGHEMMNRAIQKGKAIRISREA